jgi:pimeloyl-ACP methyl ester carboxylesterase
MAPSLGARLAERLFFTPPPTRPKPFPSGAVRFDVGLGAGRLAAWRWGGGPTVLLVHGWGSRGSHMGAFVSPLLEAGCSVVTFDAPAHGDSPGTMTSMPEMAAAVRAVAAAVGPLQGVIAHSIGGPASTLAFRDGLRVARAVFLAPAAGPEEYTRTFATRLALGPRTIETMKARAERRIGLRWSDLEVPTMARSLTIPLLLVHDHDDADVSWSESARIAEAWSGAVHVSTSGLGHRRIVRDPDVVTRAVAFVAGDAAGRPTKRVDDQTCASEACTNPRSSGDGSGHLCESCALERELYQPMLRFAV